MANNRCQIHSINTLAVLILYLPQALASHVFSYLITKVDGMNYNNCETVSVFIALYTTSSVVALFIINGIILLTRGTRRQVPCTGVRVEANHQEQRSNHLHFRKLNVAKTPGT